MNASGAAGALPPGRPHEFRGERSLACPAFSSLSLLLPPRDLHAPAASPPRARRLALRLLIG